MKEVTLEELKTSSDIIDLNKFHFQMEYPVFQQVITKRKLIVEINARRNHECKGLALDENRREIDKRYDAEIKAVPEKLCQLDIISFDEIEIGNKFRADHLIYLCQSIEIKRPAKGDHKQINGAPPLFYRLNVSVVGSVMLPKPVDEPAKETTDANNK